MKVFLKFAILLCAAIFINLDKLHGQDANFYLKSGDRVVFYGDSITEQAFYTNFVETYVVTRFPKLNVSFVNSGWSGDRVYGGDGGSADERIKRDVLPYKPTVMTVMFGMNDGCYVEFNADCYKGFTEGYERFLGLLKKNAPELRLAPPVRSGYNNVLVRYSEFVRALARKNKLAAADMNAPLVELIQRAQREDRELAQKIIADRIHPGPAGGLVMAGVLLKAWNAPAVVTATEIDAAVRKVKRRENTAVSQLKFGADISWTQMDNALPFPVDGNDKTLMLAASLFDFAGALNLQMLRVENLNRPRYKLKIDGEDIATLTREELARGVNLALLPTPMQKQAAKVHKLTQEHNQVHFTRWRQVQVPFGKENLSGVPQVLTRLDAMETELVKGQRAAAQPRPHRYQLVPVS